MEKTKKKNSLSSNQQQHRSPWGSYSTCNHDDVMGCSWPPRSYPCTYCKREFRSAQALGGHMNVHRRDRARLRNSTPPTTTFTFPHSNPNNIINPPQEKEKEKEEDEDYPCSLLTLNPNPNYNPPAAAPTSGTNTYSSRPAPLMMLNSYPLRIIQPAHSSSVINNNGTTMCTDLQLGHSSSSLINLHHNNNYLDLELRLGPSSS